MPGQAARLAFTLAEVLVTLGIIGVVSAMTVPTLMQNHQRKVYVTQLHKVYNEVSQAVEMYITDNNYLNLSESRIKNNADELNKFVKNYFKVVQDCDTRYVPCFESEYSSLKGDVVSTKNSICNVVVTIASGAAICWDSQAMDNVEDGDNILGSSNLVGQGGSIINIEVDINGKKGPNIYGRDIFMLYVDRNGNIFDKDYIENGNQADLNNKYITNGTFGKIMNEGWQMNY